jgi:ethanolamine utilization microcompartment shell protein EutS
MKKLAVMWIVLIASAAQAAPAVERTVKGQGATRELAVRSALHEAVAQVQGVIVSTGIATTGAYVGNIDVTRQEVKKSIEMEGISVQTQQSVTLTQAEGLVKTYEITEERQLDDGSFEITAKVQVYDYQSPLNSTKKTLAIYDFEAPQARYVFGDTTITGDELAMQFSQRLSTMLLASGRFNVLDRAYDQVVREEMRLVGSGQTDIEQKAMLRQVIGADYLLSGRIQKASIEIIRRELPTTGITTEEYRGYFDGEVRLLVPATREVAFSHEYHIKLKSEQIKALADEWKRDERDFNQVRRAFMDLAAQRIVEDVLSDIFPLRVALVENGRIILDQGGQRIASDAVYQVFVAGTEVVDPVSGQPLGKTEDKIADVKVTQVLPRFSYAQVVAGSASAVQVGQVCRVDPETLTIKEPVVGGKKRNVQFTPSGGVRMPFDK